MDIYWIVAFLYATYWTIQSLNEQAKEGDLEMDVLCLIFGWLLVCFCMPIVLVLQIIGVCSEFYEIHKDKGFY